MYNVSKRIIKNRFIILLINFKNCKIDNKCNKNKKVIKKVKILYFNIKRDKREKIVYNFDLKIILTYL